MPHHATGIPRVRHQNARVGGISFRGRRARPWTQSHVSCVTARISVLSAGRHKPSMPTERAQTPLHSTDRDTVDPRLVKRLNHGDALAFREIFDSYARGLILYAKS